MKKLLLAFILLPYTVLAAPTVPVFRTAPDSPTKARILYSSKPQFPDQSPATLPPIIRSDNFFSGKSPEGCAKHSGVNCLAGADKDGSVLCHDGFSNSPARFSLTCTGAKLLISNITPIQDKGAKIVIRNLTTMKASKVKVFAHVTKKNEFVSGADEIDSYGSADYIFVSERQLTEKDFSKENFSVTCGNCPNQ